MPDVTVVIPTCNRRELLLETLATVLAQRDVDFDLVVVDDGSSDGTGAAVEGLGDSRVTIVRHDAPTGVSTARNDGIAAASGTWVAFCDDDDLWAPMKLSEQLASAGNRDWVVTGAVLIDASGRMLGGTRPDPPAEILRRLPRFNVIPGGCSGVIACRALVERVGGFDPRLVNLADWDLWIRFAAVGPPAVVDEPLVGYRIHGKQRSLDTALILREADVMRARGVRVDRRAVHRYLAYVSLRAGRRHAALRHFALAAAHGAVGLVARDLWGLARPSPRPAAEATWRERAQSWLPPATASSLPPHVGGHLQNSCRD